MKALSDLLVGPDASIREAMHAIGRGTVKLALVVDDDNRLLGTISGGDVRRALLAWHALDDHIDAHMTTKPKVVPERTSRAEVLNLMSAQIITSIPVVTEDGHLVGLHLLRELLGHTHRPNWAVIMAGGLGTRLAPMTDTVPKPMLRVAGRPILERLVLHLAGSGIRRIFLSVNYLGHIIEDHFGDGSDFGCEIQYLRESPDRRLGTAGSLRLMLDSGFEPSHPLLVMNGDLVTEVSVANLLRAHCDSEATATMAVRNYSYTVPFGVAEVRRGRLTRLTARPSASWLINAGIYVLDPHILRRVPGDCMFHITELLASCLEHDEHVETWEANEEWQDIGRPEEFSRANGSTALP